MSSAGDADRKGATSAVTERKRRTEVISAAVGTALLPELIRLTAEYLPPALRFHPQLKSPNLIIVDADSEGFGNEIRYEKLRRHKFNASGFDTAVTSLPVGQVSGGVSTGRVSWRVDVLGGGPLTIGFVEAAGRRRRHPATWSMLRVSF
jgi:hypothetical protein